MYLAGTQNLGITVIDLTQTADQVTQINGQLNTASQGGFENVDGSNLTVGSGIGGLSIIASTGTSDIKGTANNDSITGANSTTGITFDGLGGTDTIALGSHAAAADTINVTVSDQVLTLTGLSSDTINIGASSTVNLGTHTTGATVNVTTGTVSLNNSSGDTLVLSGGATTLGTAGGANTITLTSNAAVTLGTHTAADTLLLNTDTLLASANLGDVTGAVIGATTPDLFKFGSTSVAALTQKAATKITGTSVTIAIDSSGAITLGGTPSKSGDELAAQIIAELAGISDQLGKISYYDAGSNDYVFAAVSATNGHFVELVGIDTTGFSTTAASGKILVG